MAEDLHALAVQDALSALGGVDCHIIESNRISGSTGLTWSTSEEFPCTLPVAGGGFLDVTGVDVIWWRRPHHPQMISPEVTNQVHISVINNDCTAALTGLLLNEFSGIWINHPVPTVAAQNKLFQLKAAQKVGFRVPQTLVSQDPAAIRRFSAALDDRIIVKAVRGTIEVPLLTTMLAGERLTPDIEECLRLCPAIYQECVPGKQHIRAHCFGESVYAVLIESDNLDWRVNYDMPMKEIELSEAIKTRLRAVLESLGLKMGICDLKIASDGEPADLFARFLVSEADRSR
jgi:hypothetical protein